MFPRRYFSGFYFAAFYFPQEHWDAVSDVSTTWTEIAT